MKILSLIILLVCAMAVCAGAEGQTISESAFPDANFRQYILDNLDADSNGSLSSAEIANVTSLTLSYVMDGLVHGYGIESLEGIRVFTSLRELDCSHNQIKSLDLSGNTVLTSLDCSSNSLISVNVQGCTKLKTLYCGSNDLTALNVLNCPAMETLNCSSNELKELDLSGCGALLNLYCNATRIVTVEAWRCPKLKELSCRGSASYFVDAHGCAALTSVDTMNSGLVMIDLAGCTKLLPILSPEYFTEGVVVSDYSANVNGEIVMLRYHNGTRIKTKASPNGEVLIDESHFPDLLFRSYVEINYDLDSSASLSKSEIAAVKSIEFPIRSGIESLEGIDVFTSLERLVCSRDISMTELDVSKCAALTYLDCSDQKIRKLTVSGCKTLETLICYKNKLYSLDCSGCSALRTLECDNNDISTLKLTGCSKLSTLSCYGNSMYFLDLSDCTALVELDCSYGSLRELDAHYCRSLQLLDCSNNSIPYARLNVTGCTKLEKLACYNNSLNRIDLSSCTRLLRAVSDANLTVENSRNHYSIANGSDTIDLWCSPTVILQTTATVYGPEDVPMDEAHFPDDTFRGWIEANVDKDFDRRITPEEFEAFTTLSLNSRYFKSLKGIEYFTNARTLECRWNNLTELDVHTLTKLTKLYVTDNELTSLNIDGLNLEVLQCDENRLSCLDVSGQNNLMILRCQSNELLTLNLDGCSSLMYLDCHDNHLRTINMSDSYFERWGYNGETPEDHETYYVYKPDDEYTAYQLIVDKTVTVYADASQVPVDALNYQDAAVILPASLGRIEAEAFMNASMPSIALPSSIDEIESRAFSSCSKLKHVFIPCRDVSIADDAFKGVTGLIIHGVAGGTVEVYAIEHGFTFVAGRF